MEDKLAELRRSLDEKTTEIEAFIAREQGMGDIRAMSPADYEQLQRDVEELLEQWKEAAPEEGYGTPEDSQLDKLISERFEIEQKILVVPDSEEDRLHVRLKSE
jgi:phage terminase small subunit